MTSITIPASVTSIGGGAFSGCTGLGKVIAAGLEEWCAIDFNAKSSNDGTNPLVYAHYLYTDAHTKVTDLVIPEAITYVRPYSFKAVCLNSLTLPDGCSLGSYAFSESSISEVTVNGTLTSVQSYAFTNATIGDITIPMGDYDYGALGHGAFYYAKIGSMTIPYGEKEISYNINTYYPPFLCATIEKLTLGRNFRCFSGYSSGYRIPFNNAKITEMHIVGKQVSISCAFGGSNDYNTIRSVYLPEGLETVDMTFCYGTNSLYIPEGVTTIKHIAGVSGQYGVCGSTGKIVFPSTLATISDNALSSCGLFKVVLPAGLTAIGSKAFYNLNAERVISFIETPFVFGTDAFKYINDNCVLTVPKGTRDAYIAAGWTTDVFKGGIMEMDFSSPVIEFADAAVKAVCVDHWDTNNDGELSEAEAAAVNDIKDFFRGNTNITSFDEFCYFTGLTSIVDYAIGGCSALTSISIPGNIASIGYGAFDYCSSLTSVTVMWETPVSINSTCFSNRENATLFVPYSCKAAYKQAEYWREFRNMIEMGDVNGDGSVTPADAIMILYAYFGVQQATFKRAAADLKETTTSRPPMPLRLSTCTSVQAAAHAPSARQRWWTAETRSNLSVEKKTSVFLLPPFLPPDSQVELLACEGDIHVFRLDEFPLEEIGQFCGGDADSGPGADIVQIVAVEAHAVEGGERGQTVAADGNPWRAVAELMAEHSGAGKGEGGMT